MPTEPKRAALRVLLVDDYWVNQKVALRMLEKLGVEAELAEDGAQAVRLVEERCFDLIFMDVQMPVMGGLEAVAKIRAMGDALARVPIIALTAADADSDAQECLDAGMDEVLQKPIKLDALVRILDALASR